MPNSSKQSGFGIIPVIVIIAAVAVLGVVGWRVFTAQTSNPAMSNTTTTQSDSNAGYVVIKEWGVRFKPVDGLTDVIYASGPTVQAINLSTSSLKALDSNCDPDKAPAIGGIERTTTPYNDPQGPHPQSLGVLGSYYYYDSPQSTCSDTKSTQDSEAQQITLLKQSVVLLEAAR